jgi:hypothetical protein
MAAFVNNSLGANGAPQFQMPYAWPTNIAQPGTYSFYQATDIHYKDPYVQEWNLTIERDLGAGVGLRLSYDGNHGSYLGMHTNLNQPAPNTIGFNNIPQADYPLPNFQYMTHNTDPGFSNYNAATVSFKKRMTRGLQFQGSYVYTRNLSNVTVPRLRRRINSPANLAAQSRIPRTPASITEIWPTRAATVLWLRSFMSCRSVRGRRS